MSLGRVVMVGTLEASSRCGTPATHPARAAEAITIKRVEFIPSLLRLLLHRAGMPDRERELRNLRVPESPELRRAHEAHREARVFVGRYDLRLRERTSDFRFEPRDDRARRAPGGHDTRPAVDLEIRKSRLDHRRHLRQLRHTPRARHRERAYLAGADVRQRGRNRID